VLTADATKDGEALLRAESIELTSDTVMSAPVYAVDFFVLNRLSLAVGQTRELQVVGFGFPSWEPSKTPLTITRRPDAPLVRPDGSTVTARSYSQSMTTPIGAFEFETWTDERGVVLKSITKMPFGVLTAELSESK
jgi:hypothetical protein